LRPLRPLLACAVVAGVIAPVPVADARPHSAAQMVRVLNAVRAHHGVLRLSPSRSLSRSSRRYARWMLARDYFGHLARIRAGRFRRLGETLAIHGGWRPQVRGTVARWMRSRPHAQILLSRSYRLIGVGRARGRLGRWRATTWVAHVGRR
jgi:uncharacterized protein YkwD